MYQNVKGVRALDHQGGVELAFYRDRAGAQEAVYEVCVSYCIRVAVLVAGKSSEEVNE